ncbi:spindle-pole body protein [Aspergillus luchuensis]|uniref:Spindle-pole body protein n=1 Tax=Aspergillus kawachii TaxID=1069201 RepID=A0A146F4J8_ASPKA|nr:spindle-pole body protein [Aspergillus luchuensis]
MSARYTRSGNNLGLAFGPKTYARGYLFKKFSVLFSELCEQSLILPICWLQTVYVMARPNYVSIRGPSEPTNISKSYLSVTSATGSVRPFCIPLGTTMKPTKVH